MNKLDESLDDYPIWIADLKAKIAVAQQNIIHSANNELLALYWNIGNDILSRQKTQGWGTGVIEKIATDLQRAFPTIKGFSARNLRYMRKFAERWQNHSIKAFSALPWFHICSIMDRTETAEQGIWYIQKAIENGWSRNVLIHQIENKLIEREGKAITNFPQTLPDPLSELATQTLKDPYIFDFLNLGQQAKERDLEQALTEQISQFLLELGSGFAFVGKQVHLEVGGDDFYLDLLFYHLKMRCYIVIELKTGEFKPEHIGQLNFYLTAVDSQIKTELDAPTIGLLLCKTRNRLVAEYALRHNVQPIGVAEYELGKVLPDEFKGQLPTIEQLEQELNRQAV